MNVEAGKIAQPLKCLFYKCRDLRSDPQFPCKNLSMLVGANSPGTEEVERGPKCSEF